MGAHAGFLLATFQLEKTDSAGKIIYVSENSWLEGTLGVRAWGRKGQGTSPPVSSKVPTRKTYSAFGKSSSQQSFHIGTWLEESLGAWAWGREVRVYGAYVSGLKPSLA